MRPPSSDPSPQEILRLRAELHAKRGDHAAARAILDRLEDGDSNPYAEPSTIEPRLRSLRDVGLTLQLSAKLERYGITTAGELEDWTEDRLRLIGAVGTGTLGEIRRALASVGLRLRKPKHGETPAPLPAPLDFEPWDMGVRNVTDETERLILVSIAAGVPQRRIAKLRGVCRWTVWNTLRRFKQQVRGMLAEGLTGAEIRDRIGSESWAAWERANEREEKFRCRLRDKPAAA